MLMLMEHWKLAILMVSLARESLILWDRWSPVTQRLVSVLHTTIVINTLDFVIGTLNQDTTGNARTCTPIETGRTLVVSFDGTVDIFPGVNAHR